MLFKNLFCLKLILFLKFVKCDETLFTINGKNSLNIVSDKFISFTIDPAVLLTGLNISTTSLKLAQHLNPAYIRIGGPSTQFIEYTESDQINFQNDTKKLVISQTMWAAINSWIINTNLTSIYSINDNDRVNGIWNSKNLYHLFDFTDRFNISTYWQLGYDCTNKTEQEYKEDIMTLYHVLQTFPDKKDVWKIVGSDISRCLNSENIKDIANDLENVTVAFMWEPSDLNIWTYPENTWNGKSFPFKKLNKIPLWTTAPKFPNPIIFSDALLWGKQIGEVASSGYNVIFRQPRVSELNSDTPIYWLSIIHKRLMGRDVLEIKPTITLNKDTFVYAHCTKKQSSFSKSGAVTIFMVNNGSIEHTTSIKMPLFQKKNIEVQSYILTSPSENSSEIYLNGKKLSIEDLDNEEMFLIPKIRRARIITSLTLSLPPKSLGFFVIPSARIPICINSEAELDFLIDEIDEDQNINFSNDTSAQLQSRFSEHTKHTTLNELYKMMEKELEADETYYRKLMQKNQNEKQDWKKLLLERAREVKTKKPVEKNEVKLDKTQEDFRKKIIENAKTLDKHKKLIESTQKKVDLKQLLLGRNRELEKKKELKKALIEDLTSSEVEKILQERQKKQEVEKFKLTSSELDEIFTILAKKFKKTDKRHKRAINMNMLKTITKDASSEDVSLNNKFKELEMEIRPLKHKSTTTTTTTAKALLPLKTLLTPKLIKTTTTTTKKPKITEDDLSNNLKIKTAYDSFESIEDDLDDHGFYEKLDFTDIKSKPVIKELFEADLNDNKLNDDELALDNDVQAYLSKIKAPYDLNSRITQTKLDRYFKLPKISAQSDESVDSFYNDFNEEPCRTKRSISSKLDNHRRIVRQSLIDKINSFNDKFYKKNIVPSLPPTNLKNDNYFKLKMNPHEEIISEIKDKIEARKDKIKEKHEEFLEKLEDVKSKIKIRRSSPNDVLQKQKTNDINEHFYEYKPLNRKKWKPEDLVKKGEFYEKKKALALKKLKEQLKQRKVLRIYRSVIDDTENEIETSENRIDYNEDDNDIIKESEKIKLKSNYKKPIMAKTRTTVEQHVQTTETITTIRSILNNTKSSILNNTKSSVLNNTKSSILNNTKSSVLNITESSILNNAELTTLKNEEVMTFNDDQIVKTTLYSYNDKNASYTPKYGTTRENIQKINVNIKPNLIERIFNSFNDFFNDIQQKLSTYFYM